MIILRPGLLILFLLLLLNSSAQEFNCGRLNNIDGKFYIDGSTNFFNGTWVSYHENGVISFQATYTRGNIYGLCQWWHDNGQKEKEIYYDLFNGKSLIDGNIYTWFPNGQLKTKANFKKGLRDGKWFKYDLFGKILKQGVYKEGIHISGDVVVCNTRPSR